VTKVAPLPLRGSGILRRTMLPVAVVVFLATQVFFLVGLGEPAEPYFDEVHYVGAARQMLAGSETLNREHPPFAKRLIALSIACFGDNPFAWRFPGALFGALALSGIYLWARQLFARDGPALWASAVTLVNQMLYVQSRIAMLDVFMAAFTVWALLFFSATWRTRHVRLCFAASGAALGFAVASKWPGLIAWALVVGIVLFVAVMKHWRVRFADPRDDDWYRPDLWREMRLRDWLLSLVLIPAAVYVLTFVPSEGADLGAILRRQGEMWRALASVPAAHPYLSSWLDWPLIRRPIWYLFAPDTSPSSDRIRAVMLLGNPLVLWAGAPAVLLCLGGWLVGRRRDAFLIAASALALYLAWAVVPKQGGFFYYYFPTGMTLGLALAYAFYETRLARWPLLRHVFLVAALGAFVYFFPVTSAMEGVTMTGYQSRMWFEGWP
jgi:dolichyl-phosphate-mannose--protein O-mannosyl transferase